MRASDTIQGTGVFRTKDILGTRVENPQGENLGNLEDLVIDANTGDVAYAVLSFGGFLGLGDKLFAIPMEALRVSTKEGAIGREQVFILNIDKDRLKNAPGFDKDNWPNMADRTWGENIYNYYGYRPYW